MHDGNISIRRVRGVGLWLIAAAILALAIHLGAAHGQYEGHPQVGWLRVADAIQPVVADHITRGIAWAQAEDLSVLVIELDTPGGLDTSMRKIIKAILASRIPIVVYVSPAGSRAASAGVFILTAAHVAAMAPGTNLGAAHPVSIGGGMPGGQGPDSTMISKVTNDAVAYIRSLAEQAGRNVAWVEDAVRSSVSISAAEALDLGVIDLMADSPAELLRAIDGREVTVKERRREIRTSDARIVEREMGLRHRILSVIANPNIAYLLLLLGGLGIFFELSHPGTLFPGIVGAICIFLAFFALQMLPVRAAGVALLALAIVLFLLEIKVTSYGALSIGGIAALTFGSLMLYDTSATGIRVAWSILLPTVLTMATLCIFAVIMVIRAQRARTVTGAEGLVGELGEARSDLDPRGKVFVHGELWNAVAPDFIPAGRRVRVAKVAGMTLFVGPAEE